MATSSTEDFALNFILLVIRMPEIIHVRPFCSARIRSRLSWPKGCAIKTDAAASIEFPPLNNALVEHGIGNLYEASDVGADYEIAGLSVLFRGVPGIFKDH